MTDWRQKTTQIEQFSKNFSIFLFTIGISLKRGFLRGNKIIVFANN